MGLSLAEALSHRHQGGGSQQAQAEGPVGTPGCKATLGGLATVRAGQAVGAVREDVGSDLGQVGNLMRIGVRLGPGRGGAARPAGSREALDAVGESLGRDDRSDDPLVPGLPAPLAPKGGPGRLSFDVGQVAGSLEELRELASSRALNGATSACDDSSWVRIASKSDPARADVASQTV